MREAHAAELMQKANVVGVGVGLRRKGGRHLQEIALVVLVKRKVPGTELADDDLLPGVIDGVPVDVVEVGEIRAG